MRPILKWAGGKRQLLPVLRPFYPKAFEGYAEPFMGSGAVFLDCYNAGLLEGRLVRLSDNNPDIIGCYRMVRDAVEDTIVALIELERGHQVSGADHYYGVRDGRFNPERAAIRKAPDLSTRYTPELAAMLIYLNKTGFNGLFRVNAKGHFNVPVGRYATPPTICDADNLRRLSRALSGPGLSLEMRPFEAALRDVAPGDFVYLDPPYAPLSATAHFTSYTAGGFGTGEQEALQSQVLGLAARGAHVLLSNSVAPEVTRLYAGSQARAAGLTAHTVPARRAINSRAAGRGAVLEYIITNVRCARGS